MSKSKIEIIRKRLGQSETYTAAFYRNEALDLLDAYDELATKPALAINALVREIQEQAVVDFVAFLKEKNLISRNCWEEWAEEFSKEDLEALGAFKKEPK